MTGTEPFSETPRILVVDDVPENLQVLRARLGLKQYSVDAASSGQQALDVVTEALRLNTLPHLILLDVQMPEMDGFEVCRRLKANDQTRDIPVIFLTGRAEIDDVVQGLNVGAVDYIIKPFNAAELMMRVGNHLELKFARDALREKNIQLEKLNRDKSEFLGIAAHDLKNPLASVRWLTDVLRIGAETGTITREKSAEALDKILLAVERMFRLVKNLLDVQAVEEAALDSTAAAELKPEVVNLVFAAATVLASYEEQIAEKAVTAALHNTATNARLWIHPEILTQILDNLVSNALKYSPRSGNVKLRIFNAVGTNAENICFAVEDDGEGIAESEQHRLFTRFTTLSTKPTAGEDSTGLGLFIVKKLTEASGGRVFVQSEQGRGSTFGVEFPVFSTQD
jgi:two-component system, sensor histidine kinase and response regulator